MSNLEKAPDATVFLSTCALLLGVFLTVTAAALANLIPAEPEELVDPSTDKNSRYRAGIRRVLFALVLINVAGTLLSIICLYFESVGPLGLPWGFVVLVYTVAVVFANFSIVCGMYVAPGLVRRRRRLTLGQDIGQNSQVSVENVAAAVEQQEAVDSRLRGGRHGGHLSVACGGSPVARTLRKQSFFTTNLITSLNRARQLVFARLACRCCQVIYRPALRICARWCHGRTADGRSRESSCK
jgi:hypothetical protein